MSKRSDELLGLLRSECVDVPWTGPAGLFKRAADEIEKLRFALLDVSELIDGYVDICDGDEETGPRPNDAMKAQQIIDEALGHE